MRIEPGSKWRNTDERSEYFNLMCNVIEANDHPSWNGEGTMEIEYSDGTVAYPKVRRFIMNHQPVRVSRNKKGQ